MLKNCKSSFVIFLIFNYVIGRDNLWINIFHFYFVTLNDTIKQFIFFVYYQLFSCTVITLTLILSLICSSNINKINLNLTENKILRSENKLLLNIWKITHSKVMSKDERKKCENRQNFVQLSRKNWRFS